MKEYLQEMIKEMLINALIINPQRVGEMETRAIKKLSEQLETYIKEELIRYQNFETKRWNKYSVVNSYETNRKELDEIDRECVERYLKERN